MTTTRVFQSGRSQAVRIPKEFRFQTDEVVITQVGASLILTPKDQLAAVMRQGFLSFTDDFMADGRTEVPPQQREPLD